MREYLLTHGRPEGWTVYSLSLTIPGLPFVTVPDLKELMRQFGQFVSRDLKGAMVYRLELQERGMPHYHALVGMPSTDVSFRRKKYNDMKLFWRDVWLHYADKLPWRVEVPTGFPSVMVEALTWESMRAAGFRLKRIPEGKRFIVRMFGEGTWFSRDGVPRRSEMRGALRRAVLCTVVEGDEVKLLRYMQDHATKAKQAQVADGWGRHWGKVGGDRWLPLQGEEEQGSRAEYARFMRMLRRLCTPHVKDKRAPFGCRLGFIPLRGSVGMGSAVYYSRVETCRRMLSAAAGGGARADKVRWLVRDGATVEGGLDNARWRVVQVIYHLLSVGAVTGGGRARTSDP